MGRMGTWLKLIGAPLLLGPVLAAPASALPVYGTSAAGELTGTRDSEDGSHPPSSVGGLTGFGSWEGDATPEIHFQLDWDIDFDDTTPGLWHYEYVFSDYERDLSHITLDLSDDCDVEIDPETSLQTSDCVSNVTINGALWTILEFGDLDGITGAVKFDDLPDNGGGLTLEFDSTRAPVYGHLAVKDGNGSEDCQDAIDEILYGGDPVTNTIACSNGLLAAGDTMDVIDYVARPDGAIPEPETAALFALGLVGFGLMRRWSAA